MPAPTRGLLAPSGRACHKPHPPPYDLGTPAGKGGCLDPKPQVPMGKLDGIGYLVKARTCDLLHQPPMYRDLRPVPENVCLDCPCFPGNRTVWERRLTQDLSTLSCLVFYALLGMEAASTAWSVAWEKGMGLLPQVEPASRPSPWPGAGRPYLTSRAEGEGAGTGHRVRVAGGAGTYPSQDKRLH